MKKPRPPLDYRKYRVRTCQTMHDCAVCGSGISMGRDYHDGGYGRRAHTVCADEHAERHDLRWVLLVRVNPGYWRVHSKHPGPKQAAEKQESIRGTGLTAWSWIGTEADAEREMKNG